MKKLFPLLLLILLVTSCAKEKMINGVTYRPYGLLNEGSCKNDSIYYEVSGPAVFSGVVFSELFFIPTVYTFGYNLYEPKSTMQEHKYSPDKGVKN